MTLEEALKRIVKLEAIIKHYEDTEMGSACACADHCRDAVAEEREVCARIAERLCAHATARAIRKRGEKE